MEQKNFYEQLSKLHEQYCPDWRFGQLLSNLEIFYHVDMFYLTDDEILELVRDFFER